MKHACNVISKLASDSLDRPLSLAEKIKFKLHLSMCSKCREYHHNITFLKRITALIQQTNYGQIRLSDTQRQQLHNKLDQSISLKSDQQPSTNAHE